MCQTTLPCAAKLWRDCVCVCVCVCVCETRPVDPIFACKIQWNLQRREQPAPIAHRVAENMTAALVGTVYRRSVTHRKLPNKAIACVLFSAYILGFWDIPNYEAIRAALTV